MDETTRAALQLLVDFIELFIATGAIQDSSFLEGASELSAQGNDLLNA